MIIRDATEADLPAIVDIYNVAVASRQSTADTEPVSVESRLPWLRDRDRATRPLWVMDADGAVAGWLSVDSFHSKPAYRITAEVSVYVATAYRRRGIARQLLQEAIRRSASAGTRTLVGLIFGHNEPSLALFEGFGFHRWAHLPGVTELDGVERDVLILGLRIDGRGANLVI